MEVKVGVGTFLGLLLNSLLHPPLSIRIISSRTAGSDGGALGGSRWHHQTGSLEESLILGTVTEVGAGCGEAAGVAPGLGAGNGRDPSHPGQTRQKTQGS